MLIIRPAALRTDARNAFAHFSMATRVPRIIRDTAVLNPDYSLLIRDSLERLAAAIESDAPIALINTAAPDYDDWEAQYRAHANETWLDAEWFFAEVYTYRLIAEAVRWWETGRDPFAPRKTEEIEGGHLPERIGVMLTAQLLPTPERLASAVRGSLWGNRIDLSYAISASHGSAGDAADTLVDDTDSAVERLLRAPGEVHIVADNTGTELAADLVLVDVLLASGTPRVTLHLKLHPTFVSDALPSDVLTLMKRMGSSSAGKESNALAERLQIAFEAGQLRLIPDGYWNSTRFIWELPARLVRTFTGASLVIVKGDANYRRLIGDAIWPPETSFAEVMRGFPAPLLALRTMKSDPVAGLPLGLAEQLDMIDVDWRINGRRGLIQFVAHPTGA